MVNINEDDIKQFSKVYLSRPMRIMINTMYYCDNMCPHCHYSCSPKYSLRNYMSESEVFAILDLLNEANFKILGVNFSGGEITTVESVNPGYIKRIIDKSVHQYGFGSKLMTNGSFINKPYADRLLNDIRDMYMGTWNKFAVQMSFDEYHKNCITDAHKIINALDVKLGDNYGIKYPFSLTGFYHNPDFMNNLNVNPRNLGVDNHLAWDLNPVGRAKENNLPHARDTKTEFEKLCGDNKLEKLIWTPLYPYDGGKDFALMYVFDCNGGVHMCDAHNQDNFPGFWTKYKKKNGKYKSMQEIQAELGAQLIESVYGKAK